MKWGYRLMFESDIGRLTCSEQVFPVDESQEDGVRSVDSTPGAREWLFVFSDKEIAEFNLKYEKVSANYSRLDPAWRKSVIKVYRDRLQHGYIKKFRALTGMTLITRNEWKGEPHPRLIGRLAAAVDILEAHAESLRKQVAGVATPLHSISRSKYQKLCREEDSE